MRLTTAGNSSATWIATNRGAGWLPTTVKLRNEPNLTPDKYGRCRVVDAQRELRTCGCAARAAHVWMRSASCARVDAKRELRTCGRAAATLDTRTNERLN